MTKEETIKVLQSIEDRAVDFPYMTACDWVAIAAAKRHLTNNIEVEEVDLKKEIDEVIYKLNNNRHTPISSADIEWIAKYFYELGLKKN